jgi:hypothetical protein
LGTFCCSDPDDLGSIHGDDNCSCGPRPRTVTLRCVSDVWMDYKEKLTAPYCQNWPRIVVLVAVVAAVVVTHVGRTLRVI